MPSLQMSVSIPFTAVACPSHWNTARLYSSSDRPSVARYVQALLREIELNGQDTPKLSLHAIRFDGGNIGALNDGQLRMIMEALQGAYAVSPDAEITAIATPGFYHRVPLTAMAEYGVQVLMDVPCFDPKECRRHHIAYKGSLSFGDITDHGIRVYGIRMLKGLERRTAGQWNIAFDGLMRCQTDVIELVDTGVAQDADAYAAFCARLHAEGYTMRSPDYFCRRAMRYCREKDTLDAYLGVGLGACSLSDGFFTRSTDCLETYIAAGGDFSRLCKLVQPHR